MSEIVIDGLQDSDTEIFKVAPAGEYEACITSAEYVTSKTGKPMLKVVYKLEDAEEYTGMNMFQYLLLPIGEYRQELDAESIRKKVAAVKQLQVACGMDASNSLDTDELLHESVRLVVSVEESDGQKQNRVREVMRLD